MSQDISREEVRGGMATLELNVDFQNMGLSGGSGVSHLPPLAHDFQLSHGSCVFMCLSCVLCSPVPSCTGIKTHALLCPHVHSCVLICPLMSSCALPHMSCVLMCTPVSSCALMCPPVSSHALLCPHMSSCALTRAESCQVRGFERHSHSVHSPELVSSTAPAFM